MLENKRPFVLRTIQYLHSAKTVLEALIQMLENKRSLCREQYNIYIDAWKQKTLCFTLVTSDVTHSRHSTHSIWSQNCPRIGLSPLRGSFFDFKAWGLTALWNKAIFENAKTWFALKKKYLQVVFSGPMQIFFVLFTFLSSVPTFFSKF